MTRFAPLRIVVTRKKVMNDVSRNIEKALKNHENKRILKITTSFDYWRWKRNRWTQTARATRWKIATGWKSIHRHSILCSICYSKKVDLQRVEIGHSHVIYSYKKKCAVKVKHLKLHFDTQCDICFRNYTCIKERQVWILVPQSLM